MTDSLKLAFENFIAMLQYDPSSPMLFSSGLFWVLFLIFLPIYTMLKTKKKKMMIFVVLFSLYFYYKSSGFFFLLLLTTSLIDWNISRWIFKAESQRKKKWLMALSITISLSILGYFKYANFFAANWAKIVGGNFQPLDIILPVGISFYTFQSISYVVDIYNGKIKKLPTWLEYIFFLSFFPSLVSGPIVRASRFLPQLKVNRKATYEEAYKGLWFIITGLVKKALIADYISQYNNLVFLTPTGYSGFESLMGIIGYTVQIYCDFSGYSDMAIGLGLILGFNLGENFRLPYQSTNLSEFWRRWHISLSSWLRDYLYIPLGGNRKGKFRTYLNNFLTMLIGGLWHGAAWKFVFWGGMHGLGLVVHKACKPVLDKIPDNFFTKAISWAITMTFVALLWVFFRADSYSDAVTIISNVFVNFNPAHIIPFIQERWLWCVMMVFIILTHAIPFSSYEKLTHRFVKSPWVIKWLIFVLVVQLVIEFMGEEVTPFIYYQF